MIGEMARRAVHSRRCVLGRSVNPASLSEAAGEDAPYMVPVRTLREPAARAYRLSLFMGRSTTSRRLSR